MSNNVVGHRGLSDQNRMISDTNRLNNGVVNGGHGSGSFTEDHTRFNKVTEEGNSGVRGLFQIHESLQVSQQQPQGPVIRWERFLPLRSIKVLLVEDDDSTRHVVSALLRNCSYEVTAVSNGLQAWKVLEDPGNRIDLILSEVAMPVLSGIGLLCKIMSHKTLKNIPVIMTSSHDSMGIVFKCLSKGAVDFLVKPIRRNELKNLWQHVWRRCHSSSGSGSENGTQTRKSAKSRSNDDVTGNNSDSSDDNDFGSKGMSVREGSDNGSGTQSSWTRCPVEIGSPHPVSPHKQLVDAHDSTCAQVMHTKPEYVSSTWVHVTEKDCHKQSELPDNVAMGKNLGMGISLNVQLDRRPEELCAKPMGKRMNNLSDVDRKQLNKGHSNVCGKGHLVHNSDKTGTQRDQVLNVIDAVTDSSSPQAESRDLNTTNDISGISQTKASCCPKQHPSLELTLKRLGGVGDAKNVVGDERNVLRRSDLSAFSKYNTASANQAQTGNVGSCSPLDNSSAPNTETTHNFACHSNGTPNQQSNGSNNINDMASTNIYLSTKGEAFDKKPESVTGVVSFNSSALQTVQNSSISSPHKKISAQAENAEMVKAQVEGSEQRFHVEHNHCHLHHYNHLARNAKLELQSDHGVSSNVFEGPVESNAANFGVDGSAAESEHGSNGQNGSSTNLTTRMITVESGNKAAGSTGASGIDRKNSGGDGTDEGRIALREAALTKFRQKRKERCFEKRVRYYSRKKLAEQRPRIKGQFVRRIVSEAKEEQASQK